MRRIPRRDALRSIAAAAGTENKPAAADDEGLPLDDRYARVITEELMPALASYFLPRRIDEREPLLMRLAQWLYRPMLGFTMRHKLAVIALAIAVLSADRKVRAGRLEKTVLLGELALDGRVRPVRGVLAAR